VLIDAHLDEVGMIVSDVLEGGFLRIVGIGGIDPAIMQAADVVVYGKEEMRGVVVSTPPHLRSSDEKKLTPIDELLIDVGQGYTKEELCELIPIGTPVGFAPCYSELSNEYIAGKSFDDKACAAVALMAVLDTPADSLAADVYVALSAREETARDGGVRNVCFREEPDYAMVIDVNLAAVPDTPRHETVDYGAGVSISISAITDRKLTKMTEKLCSEKEIKFTRIASPSSTGTNTPVMNLAGRGIPTVDVGLPLKNMHTYNETLSMSDMEELCKLVEAFVTSEDIKEAFAV
jgi:endoglucanase